MVMQWWPPISFSPPILLKSNWIVKIVASYYQCSRQYGPLNCKINWHKTFCPFRARMPYSWLRWWSQVWLDVILLNKKICFWPFTGGLHSGSREHKTETGAGSERASGRTSRTVRSPSVEVVCQGRRAVAVSRNGSATMDFQKYVLEVSSESGISKDGFAASLVKNWRQIRLNISAFKWTNLKLLKFFVKNFQERFLCAKVDYFILMKWWCVYFGILLRKLFQFSILNFLDF